MLVGVVSVLFMFGIFLAATRAMSNRETARPTPGHARDRLIRPGRERRLRPCTPLAHGYNPRNLRHAGEA